jgi:hypothetical protein
MASISQDTIVRPINPITGRNGLVDRYFYFAMSLLLAVIVIAGFRLTVDQSLFHAAPPRPFLLWVHGAAFSGWIVFYIFQSALVRTRNVKWHRLFGWFGTALAATMVPLGVIIAVIMGHFDAVVLHQPNPTFLSIPFFDMVAFGILVSLAIAWRKKPELHRRLLFIATCSLMDAGLGRFPYIFNHALFYWCLDGVILLGVVRDLVVSRKIHPVYRYAIPPLIAGQVVTIYLWRGAPAWWTGITHSILGLS